VKNIKSILIVFLCCFLSNKIQCQESLNKPNVLFIICDDLNDYQGVFGGHPQAKTPNIDRLAKSGVQFLNAHSNVPVGVHYTI
jgi:iduronate 2-sulfatase|tara:strand:- start:205 stop:453 length:249 start_codon:yes stop_codon:yes gene_type:complete